MELDVDAALEAAEVDSPPPPHERAREVVQLGYMSGAFVNDAQNRTMLAPGIIDGLHMEELLELPVMRAIRQELQAALARDDRTSFVVGFIDEVTRNAANPDVARFIDAVKILEQKHALPHTIGIGIMALHLIEKARTQA